MGSCPGFRPPLIWTLLGGNVSGLIQPCELVSQYIDVKCSVETWLTVFNKLEAIGKAGLIAREQEAAILLGRSLVGTDLWSIRNPTAHDVELISVVNAASRLSFAHVRRKWAVDLAVIGIVKVVPRFMLLAILIGMKLNRGSCNISQCLEMCRKVVIVCNLPLLQRPTSRAASCSSSKWSFGASDFRNLQLPRSDHRQICKGDSATYWLNSGTNCLILRITRKLPSLAQAGCFSFGSLSISPSCPNMMTLEFVSTSRAFIPDPEF